jgi:hypothetical protein
MYVWLYLFLLSIPLYGISHQHLGIAIMFLDGLPALVLYFYDPMWLFGGLHAGETSVQRHSDRFGQSFAISNSLLKLIDWL